MTLDIEHLTDLEVKELISELKRVTGKFPPLMQLYGQIKDDTIVEGTLNNIEYKLHRYRHPIDNTRFSISLRFSQTNETLVRIDINNGTHKNPDKTIIPQNHIHIYKDTNTNKKDDYAAKLPGHFQHLHDIFEALEDFLSYNNIKI
ncbi:DUF6978 family protein [Lactococcus cremoris]|uniref:DUF6978 family protein n=1 Tax=Lactococcus lactis subsp. cremoris TaxID=1359 RepID=UPI001962B493|nr:hypothetical protein [Lactococcus cremoris]QRZ33436.1 hypothetical protein LLW34_2313 [Lactococcus cremoris]